MARFFRKMAFFSSINLFITEKVIVYMT